MAGILAHPRSRPPVPETPLHVFGSLVASPAWPALRAMLHAAFFFTVWMVLKRIYDLGISGNGRPARPSG